MVIEIIGKLIGAVFAALAVALAPKVEAWITERIGAEKTAKMLVVVDNMVEAAEQMYHAEPGRTRKDYVETQLRALGYALTDDLDAYIEAAVLRLNTIQRTGGTSGTRGE